MRLACSSHHERHDRATGSAGRVRGALLLLTLGLLVGGCAAPEMTPVPTGNAWNAQVRALVEAWPVSTYAVLDRGQEVGRMTMRQSVVYEDGGDRLLLEDAARVTDPSGQRETVDFTYTSRCRLDDHFTPLLIESQASPGQDDSRLVVRDGRATGTTFQSEVDMGVPQRFLIRQGLMRLVSLLPRETGRARGFAFLSLGEEPQLDMQGQVRCVGPDALQLGGSPTPAWRYEYETLSGAGPRRSVSLWVADDGRFLRFHDEQGLQLMLLQEGEGQHEGDTSARRGDSRANGT